MTMINIELCNSASVARQESAVGNTWRKGETKVESSTTLL